MLGRIYRLHDGLPYRRCHDLGFVSDVINHGLGQGLVKFHEESGLLALLNSYPPLLSNPAPCPYCKMLRPFFCSLLEGRDSVTGSEGGNGIYNSRPYTFSDEVAHPLPGFIVQGSGKWTNSPQGVEGFKGLNQSIYPPYRRSDVPNQVNIMATGCKVGNKLPCPLLGELLGHSQAPYGSAYRGRDGCTPNCTSGYTCSTCKLRRSSSPGSPPSCG